MTNLIESQRCDFDWVSGQPRTVVCRRCGQTRQTSQDDPAQVHCICQRQDTGGEPPPGLAKLAARFAKDVGRFVASGGERVSQEEYDARLGICATCDQLDSQSQRCRQCGCYLKVKAWGRVWHCPLAKWPGDQIDHLPPP